METLQKEGIATEKPFSPKRRDQIRRTILGELEAIIKKYEAFYASGKASSDESPLTKERYARFEAWMGRCAQTQRGPIDVDQNEWQKDAERVLLGYRTLQALHRDGRVPPDLKAYCEECRRMSPDIEILREELPAWTRLPSTEVLKETYHLDFISTDYKEGIELQSFGLRWQDLTRAGIPEDLQRTLLDKKLHDAVQTEALPFARLLGMEEVLEESKARGLNLEEQVSTGDLFKLFHLMKLRPATFSELLAYAGHHWDPFSLPKNKRAPYIHALGSTFLSIRQNKVCTLAPYLSTSGTLRELGAHNWSENWGINEFFLVFHQE